MNLVIGGAYQGKKRFAMERYALSEEDCFECREDGVIDYSKRCICHLERYILYLTRNQKKAEFAFRQDAVIISDDISCGVVPIDPVLRAWREETGRTLNRLAGASEHVIRLFCGIPEALK